MKQRREWFFIHIKQVVWGALLVSLCLFPNNNAKGAETPVGTISKLIGAVYLQHHGEAKASVAILKDTILPRDTIKTAAGAKASIEFINGATLDIGENTDLEIKEFYYRPTDELSKSTFKMKLGRVRALIGKFTNPQSRFNVETTTAVTGVVGTEEIIINENAEKENKEKEATRAICTDGFIELGSIDPKITDKVKLGPFQEAWVFEGEGPGDVQDVASEVLEELLKNILITAAEEERDRELKQEEQEKRGKEEEKVKEETQPTEKEKEAEPVEAKPEEVKDEDKAPLGEEEHGAEEGFEEDKTLGTEIMPGGVQEVPDVGVEEEMEDQIPLPEEELAGEEITDTDTEDYVEEVGEDIQGDIEEQITEPVEGDLPLPPGPPVD